MFPLFCFYNERGTTTYMCLGNSKVDHTLTSPDITYYDCSFGHSETEMGVKNQNQTKTQPNTIQPI